MSYAFFLGLASFAAYVLLFDHLIKNNFFLKANFSKVNFQKANDRKLKAHISVITFFIFAWFGAKVLTFFTHPFFHNNEFNENTESFFSSPFFEPHYLFGGGGVFYGSLLGVILASYLLQFIFKISFFNSLTLPILIGHFIGRIGCLVAHCCYGSIITIMGFTFEFPAVEIEMIVLALMIISTFKFKSFSFRTYLIIYSFARFILEFTRAELDRYIVNNLSTSQWISLSLIIYSIFIYPKIKLRPNDEKYPS